MKDFKDLEFCGPNKALRELPEKLAVHLPRGWARSLELEDHIHQSEDDPMYVFTCDSSPSRAAAGVFLAFKNEDPGTLYVSNIVPSKPGSLSFDEYNCILDEFASASSSIADQLGVKMRTAGGVLRIEDYVSSLALEKLRRFSVTTNRSTGTAHPDDEARWFDFVVACHKEGSTLDSSDLHRWLTEEESWQDAEASDLVIEYESARSLLRYYDGKK